MATSVPRISRKHLSLALRSYSLASSSSYIQQSKTEIKTTTYPGSLKNSESRAFSTLHSIPKVSTAFHNISGAKHFSSTPPVAPSPLAAVASESVANNNNNSGGGDGAKNNKKEDKSSSSSSSTKGQKSDLAFIAKYGSIIGVVGIPWWILSQIRDDTETRHWVEESYPEMMDKLRYLVTPRLLPGFGTIPYDAPDEYRLVWEQEEHKHQNRQQAIVHVVVAAKEGLLPSDISSITQPQQQQQNRKGVNNNNNNLVATRKAKIQSVDPQTKLAAFGIANPDVISIESIEQEQVQSTSSSSSSSSSSSFPPHWIRVQIPTGLVSIETRDSLQEQVSMTKVKTGELAAATTVLATTPTTPPMTTLGERILQAKYTQTLEDLSRLTHVLDSFSSYWWKPSEAPPQASTVVSSSSWFGFASFSNKNTNTANDNLAANISSAIPVFPPYEADEEQAASEQDDRLYKSPPSRRAVFGSTQEITSVRDRLSAIRLPKPPKRAEATAVGAAAALGQGDGGASNEPPQPWSEWFLEKFLFGKPSKPSPPPPGEEAASLSPSPQASTPLSFTDNAVSSATVDSSQNTTVVSP